MLDALKLPGLWQERIIFTPLLYTLWFGPLIYLYTLAKLEPSFRLRPWHALHFVLPLAQLAFRLYAGFQPFSVKRDIWLGFYRYFSPFEDYAFYIGLALYLIASYLRLRALSGADQLATAQPTTTGWLRRFICVAPVIVVFAFLYEQGVAFGSRRYGLELYGLEWFEELEPVLYSAVLFWIAFNGYQAHRSVEQPVLPRVRKERYNLNPHDIATLSAQLDAHLANDKPYLNPALKLSSLAQQLDISAKELSFIINESKQKSFNDYVNAWRVEETKRLLACAQHAHLGLLDIAFDAGFNSKATFNRVFKQHTGVTPSQYRQEQRI